MTTGSRSHSNIRLALLPFLLLLAAALACNLTGGDDNDEGTPVGPTTAPRCWSTATC